jgi:hypothetical protein
VDQLAAVLTREVSERTGTEVQREHRDPKTALPGLRGRQEGTPRRPKTPHAAQAHPSQRARL